MTYITGFCGNGHHEGTTPTSPRGLPMKVCVAFDLCKCPCHEKFTRMYRMAEATRVEHQNPNYEPAVPVDLSFLAELEDLANSNTLLPGVHHSARPVDRPSASAPGLLESTRTVEPTPSGHRGRGQLEVEVQRVCNRAVLGEFDEHMTPQAVALLIDPDNPPSTGAVSAVFNRWEKIGYARLHRAPLYFKGLTVEGMRDGLESCRRKASGRR